MGQKKRIDEQPMSQNEFFQWLEGLEDKYELVNGQPYIMAGANKRHDRIVTSGLVAIGSQLRGKSCQPCTSDIAIKTPSGNIRYPDLSVDCGKYDGNDRVAASPALVIEVASRSTKQFDNNEKLEEYKSIPSLQYILLIDPDAARIRFYYRDEDKIWETRSVIGLDSRIEMVAIGISISLSDLYNGLQFSDEPEAEVESEIKLK